MLLRRTFCLLAGVATLLWPGHAAAQAYQINVGGLPMSCSSFAGEPVMIIVNPNLQNVGVAHRNYYGAPAIELNPYVMSSFSPLVQQWWFGHECAHHGLPPQMNTETNADCFSVRQLRQYGILNNPQQLMAFQYELSMLPGSPMGHLPGPMRAQNIINCALY